MDSGSDDTAPRQVVAQLLDKLARVLAEAERAQVETRRLQDRLRRAEALIVELQSQLAEAREHPNPDVT